MRTVAIPRLTSLRAARSPICQAITVSRQQRIEPTPRFRRPVERSVTLTELVRLTLNRAQGNDQPFGVFLFAGQRIVLCGANTARYAAMLRRYPRALVGTYDRALSVTGLLEDLQEYLEREGAE